MRVITMRPSALRETNVTTPSNEPASVRTPAQTQEQLLDALFRNRYYGQSCIVLGGGPSVARLPHKIPQHLMLIAVNAAIFCESLAHARAQMVAGVVLDEQLLLAHIREIVRLVNCPVFTGNTPNDAEQMFLYLNRLGIHRIPKNCTKGFGETFGTFSNGGNSGYAAIQLAYILGFRTVGLLGFDGIPQAGDPTHFHTLYTHRSDHEQLRQWLRQLEDMNTHFRSVGFKVVNASPVSELTRFDYVPLEELVGAGGAPTG